MTVSTSCSAPSAVRRPRSVNSTIGDVSRRHVGKGEGREPGARLQRPLASDGIGGSQLGAQFGIGHLPRQVRAGDLGQLLGHRRIGAEIGRLVGLECRVPHLERFGGITLEELLLVGCEGFVVPWAHPDRGPLKHRQMRGVPRDLRHVLDGAGACSDGRDPFTRSRFRVIPVRRVEPAAAESLSAGDVGDVGDVEHARPR